MVNEEDRNKFCGYCGRRLPFTASFCDGCGLSAIEPTPPNGRVRNKLTRWSIAGIVVGACFALAVTIALLAWATQQKSAQHFPSGTKTVTTWNGTQIPADMTAEDKSSAEAAFDQWITDVTSMDYETFYARYKSNSLWVPHLASHRVVSEKVFDAKELDYVLDVTSSPNGTPVDSKLYVEVLHTTSGDFAVGAVSYYGLDHAGTSTSQ